MLPKTNRLNKKRDFDCVFRRGERYRIGYLSFCAVNNKLKASRFGFVIGKKVSKKAVVRNKIRRQAQEEVRKALPDIKKNVDGVLIGLPGCERYNTQSIQAAIQKLFQKANIL